IARSVAASGPTLAPISTRQSVAPSGPIAASSDLDDIATTVPSDNNPGDEPSAPRRMVSWPAKFGPGSTPSRVIKYIEPLAPVAIRPRNSAPGSKVHIRTPALRADGAGVPEAAGAKAPFGVVIAAGVGSHSGQVPPSS